MDAAERAFISASCPDPRWAKWWPDFVKFNDAGRHPALRPKSLPKRIPLRAFECYIKLKYERPKPAHDPYENLDVFERVAFFVNPTAGSPVGGAREILAGARGARVTCAAFNIGDGGTWGDWVDRVYSCNWARCDGRPSQRFLYDGDIANIESPEIVDGTCSPKDAAGLVSKDGAIITEGVAPHSPEWPTVGSMPVFLEIDPTVPKIRDDLARVGIKGLVEYAHTLGIQVPVPCFFIVPNPHWDGGQQSFATYWDWLRELWAGPFALYPAEAVPDWSVIK